MQITTTRLTLRPLTMDCLEATHAYASDREATRLMCFLPNDSIGETEAFIHCQIIRLDSLIVAG